MHQSSLLLLSLSLTHTLFSFVSSSPYIMASPSPTINSNPRSFSSLPPQFMKTSSFTNNNNNNSSNMMTMDDDHHQNNWTTFEHNHQQVGLDVPKFKSVQPPSLPLSPSPISPSSYFASFSSGFSPTEFFNSPLFLSSPNVSFKLFYLHIDMCTFMFWAIINCGVF